MLAPAELEPEGEPLARGALAHAALKQTFEQLRERTGSARMEPAKLELARGLLREALEQHEPEHPLSLAPERVPGARRRLHAELERYLAHAAAHPSPLEPAELELGFGFAGEGELPAYELADGVALRGRIDRVDISAAGEAVVYDYKSSLAPASARWIGDASVQVALYMLAVEALLARPVVGGFYQPLSGADLRARGVLEEDSAIELDGVRNDVRPHAEVRELLADARALALAAAGEARSGHVQARPDSCAYKGGCMFPAICRCAP
jgi:ATP-dependent helicase/DNAse subunit B